MLDDLTAQHIATALYNMQLDNYSIEDLGAMSIWQFRDDPDVVVSENFFTSDAGAEGHGVNTEDEMLYTWSDQ